MITRWPSDRVILRRDALEDLLLSELVTLRIHQRLSSRSHGPSRGRGMTFVALDPVFALLSSEAGKSLSSLGNR